MKKQSWVESIFSFATECRGKLVLSVLCAVISVTAGIVPYWCVYQIIALFIHGQATVHTVVGWCGISLGAYAIRFIFYGISTTLSHFSGYTILETIRLRLA